MANTFTQIHLQLVFAVKYRRALIQPAWKDALCAYITGIIQHNGHKVIILNAVEDHIHILIGYKPVQPLPDLLRNIKQISAKWINENHLATRHFAWQEGYGAFSYSLSQLPRVIKYIENQQEHHRKQGFREEYKRFLEAFEIIYDEKYIFHDPED